MKPIILILLAVLLCGCSELEMTENYKIGMPCPDNAYKAGTIWCSNCVNYEYVYVKKGIPKDILDFSEIVCSNCGIKGFEDIR